MALLRVNRDEVDDWETYWNPSRVVLRNVRRLTERKEDVLCQWRGVVWRAFESQVPLADIAETAGITPQEVVDIVNRKRRKDGDPPVVLEATPEPPQVRPA